MLKSTLKDHTLRWTKLSKHIDLAFVHNLGHTMKWNQSVWLITWESLSDLTTHKVYILSAVLNLQNYNNVLLNLLATIFSYKLIS